MLQPVDVLTWGELLKYGPPGVMGAGVVIAAKLLLARLDAMERRSEASFTARDQAFLEALHQRDAILEKLSDAVEAMATEQRATALLIGSFTRLLERGESRRLAPGTADQVVAAVARELGRKP